MRHIFCTLVFVAPTAALAGHLPLLPHPQETQYDPGRLVLFGLSIRLEGDVSPEGQFAAKELSSALSGQAGAPAPVVAAPPAGTSIVLTWTGSVGVLPGLDDRLGPKSREGYTIHVDANGGEIRTLSSTGHFYGVQTVRQLIEGDRDRRYLPEVTIHDWPALAYRGFIMDVRPLSTL